MDMICESKSLFFSVNQRVKAQTSQLVAFVKQMAKELDEGTLFKHKTRDPLIQVLLTQICMLLYAIRKQ